MIDSGLVQPPSGTPETGTPNLDAGAIPVDLAPSESLPPDLLPPPDLVPDPDSSPCIFDDFNGPLSTSKVTILRGDWIWSSPSSLRQQQVNYFGGQAQVQGSTTMVSSFTAETTCTVDKVYNNGMGQGGGLSLLVRKVASNEPYRQVMCLTWMWAGTSTAKLAVAYFGGSSKSAYSLASKTLSSSPLGIPVTYTMTVNQQGNAWTGTCTISAGTKSESVTAEITSIVDATPLGVALFTTGVTADFDNVQVCPGT